MSQKYIKLIARPDTWYETGTEVLWEDSNYINRRPTLEEYQGILKDNAAFFRGIRLCDDNPNENTLGYKPGDRREDGEWCGVDEFDIEVVDEDKREL